MDLESLLGGIGALSACGGAWWVGGCELFWCTDGAKGRRRPGTRKDLYATAGNGSWGSRAPLSESE